MFVILNVLLHQTNITQNNITFNNECVRACFYCHQPRCLVQGMLSVPINSQSNEKKLMFKNL